RHPAAAAAGHPTWNSLLDGGRAENDGLALRPQHRPVRLLEELDVDRQRAELVGPAPVLALAAHAAAAPSCAVVTCSTSAIGSCRKRAPISRNCSGSPVVRKRYPPSRASSFSMPLRASVSAT